MRTLSKYQIKTLRLWREGKTLKEICEKTGDSQKRVSEALKRAGGNIQRAIEILRIASENGGLTEEEVQKLRRILGKP